MVSMTAATGTVTGATYDLSLGAPVGPDDVVDRRIKSFLGGAGVYLSSPVQIRFYGQGGNTMNPGIAGVPGMIAIYELLS
jgi:hypothetical protein